MRISCPSCAAIYEVPDELLRAEARKLRCVRCGAEWTRTEPIAADATATPTTPAPLLASGAQEALEPVLEIPEIENRATPETGSTSALPLAPIAPPDASPRLEARDHAPPAPTEAPKAATNAGPSLEPRSTSAVWFGWAASIVVILVLVWAGYSFRAGVMRAWPPSAHLYAALGLQPPPPPSAAPPHSAAPGQ